MLQGELVFHLFPPARPVAFVSCHKKIRLIVNYLIDDSVYGGFSNADGGGGGGGGGGPPPDSPPRRPNRPPPGQPGGPGHGGPPMKRDESFLRGG